MYRQDCFVWLVFILLMCSYFLITNSFNIKSVVLLDMKLVVADNSYQIFGELVLD